MLTVLPFRSDQLPRFIYPSFVVIVDEISTAVVVSTAVATEGRQRIKIIRFGIIVGN